MMIERKNMVLEQITRDRYLELKSELSKIRGVTIPKPIDISIPKPRYEAYAEIKVHLTYNSFEELLVAFKNTKLARRVSVKEKPKVWHRFYPNEIRGKTIRELTAYAMQAGFLSISFVSPGCPDYINDEIVFETFAGLDKIVVSSGLYIPGVTSEINHYSWQGPKPGGCLQIRGVYLPKNYMPTSTE